MPLYFFRLTGPSPFFDPAGVELADDDAAWSLAVASTGEMLRDLDGALPQQTEIVATVTDERGQTVGKLRVRVERRRN